MRGMLFALFLATTVGSGIALPSELWSQKATSKDSVKVDSLRTGKAKNRRKDKFIDRDGDGVNDSRQSYTNGVIRAVLRKSRARKPKVKPRRR